MFSVYDYRDRLKNEDKVRDVYLNNFGELNLEFLRANADKFTYKEWCYISYFANLTKDFVEEFSHELEMSLFFENNYTSNHIKSLFRGDYISGYRRGYEIKPTLHPVAKEQVKRISVSLFVLADEVYKK